MKRFRISKLAALAMAGAALISPTDSATRGEGVSTRVAYSITTTNTGVKACSRRDTSRC